MLGQYIKHLNGNSKEKVGNGMENSYRIDKDGNKIRADWRSVAFYFCLQLIFFFYSPVLGNLGFLVGIIFVSVSLFITLFFTLMWDGLSQSAIFLILLVAVTILVWFNFNTYAVSDLSIYNVFYIIWVFAGLIMMCFRKEEWKKGIFLIWILGGINIFCTQQVLEMKIETIKSAIAGLQSVSRGEPVDSNEVSIHGGVWLKQVSTAYIWFGYWFLNPMVSSIVALISAPANMRKEKRLSKISTVEKEKEAVEKRYDLRVEQEKENFIFWEQHVATKESVNSFLSQWESVRYIIGEPKEVEIPKKWLTLDEQYEYLNGLQGRLNEHLMQEFPYMKWLIENNGTKYMRSYMIYLCEESIKNNDMKGGYRDQDRYKHMLQHLEEQGLSSFKWSNDFGNIILPFSQYVYNRFIKQDIKRHYDQVASGINGEKALEEELSFLDDRFKILYNVRVKEGEISSESDAIVVCPFGIFTIEAKNFSEKGQYSIHIAKDGKWTRIDKDKNGQNGKRKEMKDVVAQNNRHVLVKQKMLNRILKEQKKIREDDFLEIEGVIAITNDVVEIENELDFPVIRLSGLYHFMKKQDVLYSTEEINLIVNIFEKNMLPPQKFPITDYEKEYENYQKAYAHIKSTLTHLERLLGYPKID